jgi:hypothetical protein
VRALSLGQAPLRPGSQGGAASRGTGAGETAAGRLGISGLRGGRGLGEAPPLVAARSTGAGRRARAVVVAGWTDETKLCRRG